MHGSPAAGIAAAVHSRDTGTPRWQLERQASWLECG